jgi:hypothetical protein
MKLHVLVPALALAVLAQAAPVAGQEAGPNGVTCIAQSYGAQTASEIESLFSEIDFDDDDSGLSFDQLVTLQIAAAEACTESHGWSEERLKAAFLFEFGRLAEAAFRRHGFLSAENLAAIDAGLEAVDQTGLWAALEPAIITAMRLDEDAVGTMDLDQPDLVEFFAKSGMPVDVAVRKKAAALLYVMALQRIGTRDFAASNGGQ